MTDAEACIILNMLPRMGPIVFRKLLKKLGSPEAILRAGERDLLAVDGAGPELARNIRGWERGVEWEREFQLLEKHGWRAIPQTSPEYPEPLREIADAPILLNVWGALLPRDNHAVGVVGTRKPSHYGSDCAKRLSYQLAHAGLTVVSGLARGVDTFAHQGAIAAHGRTIAVIGSGLGCLYPPENRELAARIAGGAGAVVSEFPVLTQADRQTFPMRNRIISGLSFGLLVVEAGVRSGALISASQAGDQGRSVYAIPGRIDMPGAMGSNRLIQQGAKLVLSAEDILEDLQILFPKTPALEKSVPPVALPEAEKLVYDALGDEETTIDEMVAKTGLPSHRLSSSLLALESRGLVKSVPGGRFLKLL